MSQRLPIAFGAVITVTLVIVGFLVLIDRVDKDKVPLEGGALPDGCSAPRDICNKAAAVQKAVLVNNDFDWLVRNYPPPGFIVCNTDDPYFGNKPPPPHLCQGAGPSEQRFVYTLGEQLLSAEEYMDVLREWVDTPESTSDDRYGSAVNRLYTIGCADTPGTPPCSEGFILVFSKLSVQQPERSNLVLFIQPRDQGKVSTFIGPIQDLKHLDSALKGGTAYGFFGPSGRATTFYALN